MDSTTKSYKSIINSYLSGYISGVSAILVSHPIDTIKTNYQERIPIKINPRTLYKGILPPMLGIGLEKAIVFGTYNSTYEYTKSHAVSGAMSGLAASFIVTPYERIKILYQTNHTNISITPKYLYKGLSATFYREVPGFAIYFSMYNYLKSSTEYMFSRNITLYESFMFGGFSGAFSWIFIYPQDRIKTHIQSSTYKITLKQGMKDIINDGGILGLYRGFHYALMRAIPLHATAFMVNEICNRYMSLIL
jgi:solute carrier family 25 carnitine/acylcarnitine transporter 20/29